MGLQDFDASEWVPGSVGSRSTFGGCSWLGVGPAFNSQGNQGGRRHSLEAGCLFLGPCLFVSVSLSLSWCLSLFLLTLSLSLPLPVSSLPPTQASLWAARREVAAAAEWAPCS